MGMDKNNYLFLNAGKLLLIRFYRKKFETTIQNKNFLI